MIQISSSVIKDILYHGEYQNFEGEFYYCPLKVKEVSIERNYESVTTEAMLYGKFFETLCLGEGREGEKVLDLPRKKLTKKQKQKNQIDLEMGKQPTYVGDKKLDHIRIEDQANFFKHIFLKQRRMKIIPNGIGKNIQIQKKKLWEYGEKYFGEDILITGNIDIYDTPFIHSGKLFSHAIIDLKLTKNINSTFGDYAWSAPENIDHIQPKLYSYITGMPFFYIVFDYMPKSSYKVFYYEMNKTKFLEMHESIRKAVERIIHHNNFGWEPIPKAERCKNCPVNELNGGYCKESSIDDFI